MKPAIIAVVAIVALLCAAVPRSHAVAPPGGAARTELVSVAHDGSLGSGGGGLVSADGRFVAFGSTGSQIVSPFVSNINYSQVYIRDRQVGTNELISKTPSGQPGGGSSSTAAMTPDGRYIAFYSFAPDLIAGAGGTFRSDLFLYDRSTQSLETIDVDSAGNLGSLCNGCFSGVGVSDDGRYVVFGSSQTGLVPNDGVDSSVFLRDRQSGTTTLVAPGINPSISADGRHVAFASGDSTLVSSDTNGQQDIFVFDRDTQSMALVSIVPSGGADSWSLGPAISGDGTHVVFISNATNLVPGGDHNGYPDIYERDLTQGVTQRVTVSYAGGDATTNYCCSQVGGLDVSQDGRFVSFASYFGNLVPGDDSASSDAFVRDTVAGSTWQVSVRRGIWHFSTSSSPNGRYAVMSVSGAGYYDDLWNLDGVWIHDNCGTAAWAADTDQDGAPDCFETSHPCMNAAVPDTDGDPDGDSRSSGEEMDLRADPCSADSDHDGMSDEFEFGHACMYPDFNDAQRDLDHDGLSAVAESTRGMSPCSSDTDGDGIGDAGEFGHACLDPLAADAASDSDGDGLSNSSEVGANLDPCSADTDGDELPDGYEVAHSCLLAGYPNADADSDSDGLPNGAEYAAGTDPCDYDTDGDFLFDGDEVNTYHTDPLKADTDGDGLTDFFEVLGYHSNPLSADTDG
ncbi:MAG: hypothetical protein EPO22_08525, partial [Dehalococcoidia bacterium]